MRYLLPLCIIALITAAACSGENGDAQLDKTPKPTRAEILADAEAKFQDNKEALEEISDGLRHLKAIIIEDSLPDFTVQFLLNEQDISKKLHEGAAYSDFTKLLHPVDSGALKINSPDANVYEFALSGTRSRRPLPREDHKFFINLFGAAYSDIGEVLDRAMNDEWSNEVTSSDQVLEDMTKVLTAEYILVSKKVDYYGPKFINNSEFESGYYTRKFILYNVREKQFMGTYYLHVESSETLSHKWIKTRVTDKSITEEGEQDLADNMRALVTKTLPVVLTESGS